MKIVCPACAAAYEVPEGRLLPGRIVRCARCDTDWAPIVAEEPEPEPVVAPPPAPIQVAEPVTESVTEPTPDPAISPALPPPSPPDTPKRNLGLLAAWVLSIGLLLGGIGYAYAAREAIMRHWAPSARLYGLLGLTGGLTREP